MEAGAWIEVDVGEAPAEVVLRPQPEVQLVVLYEDEHLVAVNKPGPLPSHPLRADEGPTAAGALIARFSECASASEDPREGGLGHRLDRGTSGVLLAARTRTAWHGLRAALGDVSCEKSYLAEVAGHTPLSEVVFEPIGRGGPRGGQAVVGGGRDPLPARTEVERVALRSQSTLVRARLASGRVHQVRAHLAHLGHPVLGDEVYADGPARLIAAALQVDGLRLHAESVRLQHPVTGTPLRVTAPPPDWAR